MADAITLILLVAAGESADPTTRAIARASRDALGSASRVVVRESSGTPSDAEALNAERAEASDAVAEVVWVDSRHRAASLRVHVSKGSRWFDRSIDFRSTDADAERGRTLGFAIAAIVPPANGGDASSADAAPAHGGSERSSGAEATPGQPSRAQESATPSSSTPSSATAAGGPASVATPPGAPPAAAPGSSARPRGPSPSSGPSTAANSAAGTSAPTHTESPPGDHRPSTAEPNSDASDHGTASSGERAARAPRGAVDVLFLAVPSRGAGYGGTISARVFVLPMLPMLAIRVVGGIRQGVAISTAPDPVLTSVTWMFGGGLAVHLLRSSPAQRFGLGLRADALGEDQTITWQTVPTSPPKSAVLFAVDAAAEASYLLLPDVEGVLGGGFEYDYARESDAIRIPGSTIAMPNRRGFVDAGIRIRF